MRTLSPRTRRGGFRSAALGLGLVLAACGAPEPAADRAAGTGRVVPLFATAGEERAGHDAQAPSATRYRPVRINPVVATLGGVEVGERLLVEGFSGRSFEASVDRVGIDLNNVITVRGRLRGREGAYVLVSLDRARALGVLEVPGEGLFYTISPGPEPGTHLLQDLDPRLRRDLTEPGPPPLPPATGALRAALPAAAGSASATARLDVMIVYTPSAQAWAEGHGGVNAVLAQAVENGQMAFDNSQVEIELRLVHSGLVSYQERDASTDLYRLTDRADGYMDEVHGWRDTYGADLVTVVTTSAEYCGLGWLLGSSAGTPDYGFSWVAASCLGEYTLVHELGHNFGAHHRKDQPTSPGPGFFPYSAGWRWIGGDDRRYCSVMSYTDAWAGQGVTRAPYFSSPLVTHQGAPTGDAVDGDNARTLRETKALLAAYRPPRVALLTIRAGAGGTTSPPPGKVAVLIGAETSVRALPETHFEFLGWSGDASGSANPVTLRMDVDKSVSASFQRIIYPPAGARGEKVLNRSLSQVEYINVLTWQADPNNLNVVNYRIYVVTGGTRSLLATLGPGELEYWHRRVKKESEYVYQIVAVNDEPREGRPAAVTVR
jgi:hypothetical protein